MNREILDFLKMNDVEYKERRRLADVSPIRIGGEADIMAYPDSEEKLIGLIAFLENINIKYKIVGRMSNILFSDKGYRGVIIRTDRICEYSIDRNILSVSCGASLPLISDVLCRAGLSGFERLSGIPGSIAGALVGNAGAFGSEIADRLLDVKFLDIPSRELITLSRNELEFFYRTSSLKRMRAVILSARFSLTESDAFSIKGEMDRCREIRRKTQPIGIPSLGSVFKRPCENVYAAKLIDECGLKGYSIGGAQISKKHAGFIVNTGGATAENYIGLSNYAKGCVLDRFGIHLEREVEIV